MYTGEVITLAAARTAYNKMHDTWSRLPLAEPERRLKCLLNELKRTLCEAQGLDGSSARSCSSSTTCRLKRHPQGRYNLLKQAHKDCVDTHPKHKTIKWRRCLAYWRFMKRE